MTITQSVIRVSCVNNDQLYYLASLGSRMYVVDIRETKFNLKGANEVMVRLNTSGNNSSLVRENALQANLAGGITIRVTVGKEITMEPFFNTGLPLEL